MYDIWLWVLCVVYYFGGIWCDFCGYYCLFCFSIGEESDLEVFNYWRYVFCCWFVVWFVEFKYYGMVGVFCGWKIVNLLGEKEIWF